MNKILFALLFIFAFGNDNEKLVYIKQNSILSKDDAIKYVGQIIGINYNVTILENSKIKSIGFIGINDSVSIKNESSSWIDKGDGILENTFYFKIKSKNFFIPTLEIIVDNNGEEYRIYSDNLKGNAIPLVKNNYSGVIANNLILRDHNISSYDDANNIIILDLEAIYSNLEDFKLKNISKQGFKNLSFSDDKSSAIYYAILPKNIMKLKFDYFNLESQQYKTIDIENIISNNGIVIIDEKANNKNYTLIFKNIVICIIIFSILISLFFKKIPFKIKLSGLIIAIALIIYLYVSINVKKEGILNAKSHIRILPIIDNSTILEKVNVDTKVTILNSYNDYYKILTSNNKVGWVKKSEVK